MKVGLSVEQDKIAAVGPRESVRVPKDARVIAMPGTTLLPGLIEGHSHLLLYPATLLIGTPRC